MPIERAGFAGLGTMGKPMVFNAMKAGFPLAVFEEITGGGLRSDSLKPKTF